MRKSKIEYCLYKDGLKFEYFTKNKTKQNSLHKPAKLIFRKMEYK